MPRKLPHDIYPDEIILEEFIIPMKISQTKLTNAINLPLCRINEIVLSKSGITTDTALRLARIFAPFEQFWRERQGECKFCKARNSIKE